VSQGCLGSVLRPQKRSPLPRDNATSKIGSLTPQSCAIFGFHVHKSAPNRGYVKLDFGGPTRPSAMKLAIDAPIV
jgi:hypothetical protein